MCSCPVGAIRSRVVRAREDLVAAVNSEPLRRRRTPQAELGSTCGDVTLDASDAGTNPTLAATTGTWGVSSGVRSCREQLDGEAIVAEQAGAEAHLDGCAGCRACLDQAAAVTRRSRLTVTAPGT